MSMAKPKVFLSHIHEEAELADTLKRNLSNDFLGLIDIFVSSDGQSIPIGNRWLRDVEAALIDSRVHLVLCSERSVGRPWINFETGAAWNKGVPVVPLCHTGMRPSALPLPLNLLQGVEVSQQAALKQLYELLATTLGAATPNANFAAIAEEIKGFEHMYGLVRSVSDAVASILAVIPEIEPVFEPSPTHRTAIIEEAYDWQIREMRPHLDVLKSKGMADYAVGTANFSIGPHGGGTHHRLTITLHDEYYRIAYAVLS
jgi:TIR domain